MIKFSLNKVLQELNISQNKFAKQTNIRPNTINDICNNRTKRIEVSTLNRIMLLLNQISNNSYEVGDIIKFENESD